LYYIQKELRASWIDYTVWWGDDLRLTTFFLVLSIPSVKNACIVCLTLPTFMRQEQLDEVSTGELQRGTAVKVLALTDKVNRVKVKPVSVCEDEVLQFHKIFTFITLSCSQPRLISTMLFACSVVCKYKFVLS
jgi:hypothetical protein